MRPLLLFSVLSAAVCTPFLHGWQRPSISAQEPQVESAPHFTLRSQNFHRIGVALFSSGPNSMCDARGEIFFDSSPFDSAKALLRVREDGTQPTPIPFPTDVKGHWHFTIDSSGDVFLLVSNVDNPLLIHLSPSGEEVSRTDLALPKFFSVHSFTLQPDGRSLFFGSLNKLSEENASGSSTHSSSYIRAVPFLLWLDPTGKLLRKEPFGKEFSPSTTFPDGMVTTGRPGIFFTATSTAIREYGAEGDLFRTFPIVPPAKNSTLSNLQFVDGRLALLFLSPAASSPGEGGNANQAEGSPFPYFGPLDPTWLLVSPVSGELEGYYDKPKDLVGSALCYLGHHSFIYDTVQDNRPFLVEAEPSE